MTSSIASARRIALLLTLALAAAGLTACQPAASNKVPVAAGTDANLQSGALTVEIPGKSIQGSGELTASDITADGLSGYAIRLTGAKLVGPATISFRHKLAKDEPAPLMTYSEGEGKPTRISENQPTVKGDTVTVTTNHFSNWFPVWWGDFVGKIGDLLRRTLQDPGDAGSVQCAHTADAVAAGVLATMYGSGNADACLDLDTNQRPLLKVANKNAYPVTVEATEHMVLTNQDTAFSSLFAQLLAQLSEPPLKSGNTMALLAAGGQSTYQDASKSEQGINLRPSAAGYVASALLHGFETMKLFVPLIAKSKGPTPGLDRFTDAMEGAGCVLGAGHMGTARVDTPDRAVSYLNSAIQTMFSCLGKAMGKLYGADGLAAGLLVAGIAWVGAGVKSVATAVAATVDSIKNPHGVTITVTQKDLLADKLNSITAPPMCTRPAGKLVNGSLPIADPLHDGVTQLAKDVSKEVLFAENDVNQNPAMAVTFQCSAGGVGWPDVIGFYDEQANLLGYQDLGDIDHNEHSAVHTLQFKNGTLHVEWATYEGAGYGTCDPNQPDEETGDFAFDAATGTATLSNFTTSCPQGD